MQTAAENAFKEGNHAVLFQVALYKDLHGQENVPAIEATEGKYEAWIWERGNRALMRIQHLEWELDKYFWMQEDMQPGKDVSRVDAI